MKAKYQIMVMSFDGEYKIERPEFETVEKAWDYSNDLGSKWFFYPFHFVIKGKTVIEAPDIINFFSGMRISRVAKEFFKHSKEPDMEGADVDKFAFSFGDMK